MLMNPSRRRVEGNTGGGIPAAFFGVPRHGTTGCCPCLAAPVLMLDPEVAPSMAPLCLLDDTRLSTPRKRATM